MMTGKQVYRDMTKFWGKLFGINFAMGVTTGITLEFQFGTNWAYYSHYVGDVFGSLLAIEGLMAFFLESTFVGLFFFGWDRLSKVKHLGVTFLVAVGSNLSALWILMANGWMQNPVGAEFNYHTMRMELTSFTALLFNPVAQVKFVHTVAAGYVTASMFVLGISSWYLLQKRDVGFAMRSFTVAAGFGLASCLSVILLGDESGYTAGEVQKTKLAAIEAEWHTEPAPAAFTVIGWPNTEAQHTDYAIKVPYVLGLIATRSTDQKVTGIDDLVAENRRRIVNGIDAAEWSPEADPALAEPYTARTIARRSANKRALEGYSGEKHAIYAELKLAGLKEAPVHLAVFSDDPTHTGSGLGQQTMPETLHYSVVAAIQTLWLAARADGIGMGWVSILDPVAVTKALDVPEGWSLVAYLCLGLPAEEHLDPELERHHWEQRTDLSKVVFTR